MIVANKCDSSRKVSEQDLEKYKNEVGAIGVMETSAKNGNNVNDAFNTITRTILGR